MRSKNSLELSGLDIVSESRTVEHDPQGRWLFKYETEVWRMTNRAVSDSAAVFKNY